MLSCVQHTLGRNVTLAREPVAEYSSETFKDRSLQETCIHVAMRIRRYTRPNERRACRRDGWVAEVGLSHCCMVRFPRDFILLLPQNLNKSVLILVVAQNSAPPNHQ